MNHFVTLFNFNFLPQGLGMIGSLKKNIDCVIWVICLDEKLYDLLKNKNLENVKLIQLKEIEKEIDNNYRKNRKFLEYCWMLTPFSMKYVLNQDSNIKEVTYVDADVYFYKDIKPIFEEFNLSNKNIFITEHGYHKKHNKTEISGRFCVQFLIMKNNLNAEIIRNEWEKKCVESTTIDHSKNIVGDQKYFDDLYNKYSNDFCVSKNLNFFQAPWTLDRFNPEDAILYHFHSLRVLEDKIMLYSGYNHGENIINKIYLPYIKTLKNILEEYKLKFNQTISGEKENVFLKIKKIILEKLFKIIAKREMYKYIDINKIL